MSDKTSMSQEARKQLLERIEQLIEERSPGMELPIQALPESTQ